MIAGARLYLALVLVFIPFGLSGLFSGMEIVGWSMNLIIVLLLLIDYQLTVRPHLLSARRINQERLSIGRANRIELELINSSATSLQMLVKDDYPQAFKSTTEIFEFSHPADSKVSLEYEVTPARRGLYRFGGINIRYKSFLGLFWRQIRLEQDQEVKVYSDLKTLYQLSVKLAQSTEIGELHRRKRGQGTDFATLKEYTVGDDSKSIDWKATARRERPVVRTYEAEQEQRLLILLDAGRMMMSDLEGLSRFDHALNAALCLALTGLSHNDQVSFGIFADKPLLYLPPQRGKAYMRRILEATYSIEPVMVEPDYAGMLSYFATIQKGRALIVLLTDLTDPIGSQALLSGLARLRSRNLPFCVTLNDRRLPAMAASSYINDASGNEKMSMLSGTELSQRIEAHKLEDEISGIYRRAIATDLIEQRQLALNVLQRKGCLILDCPPQELSEKLMDAYLDIKARARL